jgi:alkylhydroperoxidase family enzyme
VEEELVPAVMAGEVDDPRLTQRERAALAFADQYWHDHNAVDDELWGELMDAFTPEEFIELAMSVGQYTAMGKIIAMLGVPNPLYLEELQD